MVCPFTDSVLFMPMTAAMQITRKSYCSYAQDHQSQQHYEPALSLCILEVRSSILNPQDFYPVKYSCLSAVPDKYFAVYTYISYTIRQYVSIPRQFTQSGAA